MTVAVFGTNVLRRQLWVTLPFGASSPGSRHCPSRAGRKVQNCWHFCRLIFVKCRTVLTIGMNPQEAEGFCLCWKRAWPNRLFQEGLANALLGSSLSQMQAKSKNSSAFYENQISKAPEQCRTLRPAHAQDCGSVYYSATASQCTSWSLCLQRCEMGGLLIISHVGE